MGIQDGDKLEYQRLDGFSDWDILEKLAKGVSYKEIKRSCKVSELDIRRVEARAIKCALIHICTRRTDVDNTNWRDKCPACEHGNTGKSSKRS